MGDREAAARLTEDNVRAWGKEAASHAASFEVRLAASWIRLSRANEGLTVANEAALAHARGLRMDTPKDEAIRLKLVETLEMASSLAGGVVVGRDTEGEQP